MSHNKIMVTFDEIRGVWTADYGSSPDDKVNRIHVTQRLVVIGLFSTAVIGLFATAVIGLYATAVIGSFATTVIGVTSRSIRKVTTLRDQKLFLIFKLLYLCNIVD